MRQPPQLCSKLRCTMFGSKCEMPAKWSTPSGYRCERCAREDMENLQEGSCLFSLLKERGQMATSLLLDFRRIG